VRKINTVTGTIATEALGRTLMHEHLLVGMPGWETDDCRPGPARRDIVAICLDRIAELKDHGIASFVDPCANDMGRDPDLMAEVAAKAGFNIICATGLFSERLGNSSYWRSKLARTSADALAPYMAEIFIRDLTDGIGRTGVRAGIIKVATGAGEITAYERLVFKAAAMASLATGAPVTTHTQDGKLGDLQQEILTGHGVAPNRIIIGHSCSSSDHGYHMHICRHGSYLGFDQFGIQVGASTQSDEARIAALIRLIGAGAGGQVVVSNDSPFCWRGSALPRPAYADELAKTSHPLRFTGTIAPKLRELGVDDADITRLLVDNPRRYFEGAPLPAL
jgi:phosphotriesterase-related protein